MTTSGRVQRYRATYEFVLKDRSDYNIVRPFLQQATEELVEILRGNILNDYLAIEKVEDDKLRRR